MDHYQRALAIAGRTGSRDGELYALYGLGFVHTVQGRCGQAVDSFERALGLARQIGDRNGEFEAHQGLGRVHLAAGSHHNEEPEVTSTAVRAHLHELEHLSAAG